MSRLLSTVILLIFLLCISQFFFATAKSLLKHKKTHKTTTSTSFISIPLMKNKWDMPTKKKFFEFLSESHNYLVSKEVDSLLETKIEKKARRASKSATSDKKSINLYNFKNTQVFTIFEFIDNIVKIVYWASWHG